MERLERIKMMTREQWRLDKLQRGGAGWREE